MAEAEEFLYGLDGPGLEQQVVVGKLDVAELLLPGLPNQTSRSWLQKL